MSFSAPTFLLAQTVLWGVELRYRWPIKALNREWSAAYGVLKFQGVWVIVVPELANRIGQFAKGTRQFGRLNWVLILAKLTCLVVINSLSSVKKARKMCALPVLINFERTSNAKWTFSASSTKYFFMNRKQWRKGYRRRRRPRRWHFLSQYKWHFRHWRNFEC